MVRHVMLPIAIGVTLILSACNIPFTDGATHTIGTESFYRVNLVVFRAPTKALYEVAKSLGYNAAREIVRSNIPPRISVPAPARAIICSIGLCVAPEILYSIIRSKIRSDMYRSDFPEALRSAALTSGRCFADTLFPSANLTTKGYGTSGCRYGQI